MVLHFLIDWIKSYFQLNRNIFEIKSSRLTDGVNRRYDVYFFIIDQILHLSCIVVISYWWIYFNKDWSQFAWLSDILAIHPLRVYAVISLLILLKPANILILQILRFCKLGDLSDSENSGNFHAGALIGYLERGLILLFVLLSQYDAIGLLIAAKSILRFSEASSGNVKSEYVLSGTLLSLAASLSMGLFVLNLPKI